MSLKRDIDKWRILISEPSSPNNLNIRSIIAKVYISCNSREDAIMIINLLNARKPNCAEPLFD